MSQNEIPVGVLESNAGLVPFPFRPSKSPVRSVLDAVSDAGSRARSIWCWDDPIPSVAEFFFALFRPGIRPDCAEEY